MQYEIKDRIIFIPFEIKIQVENNMDANRLLQLFDLSDKKDKDEFDEKLDKIYNEIERHMI